jgi:hypothetical protein
MMFTRKNLAVLAVAVVALAVPVAQADIILPNVDFILNLRNFDMGTPYSPENPPVKGPSPAGAQPNEDGWGIFKVTAISDTSAHVLWADGQDGMELTGIFYGLQDLVGGAVWDPIDLEWTIRSTGLTMDIWHNPHGSFDAGLGSTGRAGMGASGYKGITDVGGTKILSAETRAPGVFGLPEFQSTVNVAGFGDSRAWADVITTVGTQPANFSTGSQLGGTDLYLSSDVFFPGTVADWQFESSDLVKGRFVPEPFSLGLLGIGAVALLRRRRRA